MATKTSILIFYLRLAKNTQIVLRYASWATLAVVNISGIVLTFMNIFQCSPIHAAWSARPPRSTKCIPLLTEFICAAPVNIVTDLAILALPIPVLTGMRLPSRQKTILVFTFTIGIFVTVVDVIRIYYLQQAIHKAPTSESGDPGSRFGGEPDFAWNASLSLMWSAVEVNVAMTCACVPTLKPLVVRLLPAMLYDPDGTRSRTVNSTKGANESDNAPSAADPSPVSSDDAQSPPVADEQQDAQAEEPVTGLEFLTTPDMAGVTQVNSLDRSHTNVTASTSTMPENGVYFGFVNMTRPKSMLKVNTKEAFKYCTVVSILFLLWGFSYGLLNTLNNVIATVNNMSTAQTLGLTSIYFGGGYFFGPLLVGEWILRRDEHNRSKRHRRNNAENTGGYKVTFIVGLCIYGIGTIIFWPSAVTNSYGGFMLSSFVVGFGLSVLEVGANSFMILCGHPDYAEPRLLLAQAIQAIGSVLSGLLAQKVFFNGIHTSNDNSSLSLINVQWTYLGITLLTVALGLFFFYMPLPEVSDRELEDATKRLPVNPEKRSIFGLQLRTVSLTLAVFAQYLYIATQEGNSIFFGALITYYGRQSANQKREVAASMNTQDVADPNEAIPAGLSLTVTDFLLIAHSSFALSRLLFSLLTYLSVTRKWLPKPRTILTICVMLCFVFALLFVVLRPPNPNLSFIPMCLFFFAEGPMWPLIFCLGLRGQGRRTKRAAAFITMGGSGAAFFPFVMYGITHNGGSIPASFIVIVALQVAMIVHPIFLDCVRDARLLVDPGLLLPAKPRSRGAYSNGQLNGSSNEPVQSA